MGHTATTVTAPVLTTDVSTVLAVASHNIGYLCSNLHKKTNKFAKFKPEKNSTTEPLSLQARKSNNFGLVAASTYTSKTAFINAAKSSSFNPGWNYQPPTGGAGSPFRIGDFNGYDHEAKSPFGTLNPFTGMLSSSTTTSLTVPCEAPADDPGSINIADMQNGTNNYSAWYFGILLYNGSRSFMATATQPISTLQNWQVDFGWINPSYAGEYTGVPFLSSKPFTTSGSEPSGVRIVGTGNKGVKIVLKSTSETYIPFANCMYADQTSGKIKYTVQIQNTTNAKVTFTNVVLEVATNASGGNSMTLVSFGSISVEGGKSWITDGTATASSRSYQFCRLRYAGASNSAWVDFDEPETDAEESPFQ